MYEVFNKWTLLSESIRDDKTAYLLSSSGLKEA